MQCALERRERPGGRPVAVAIRLAMELAQDALLLGGRVVQDGWPTSVAWLERRQPLMIEQTDQRRDGVARRRPARCAASTYAWPLATASKTFERATSAAGRPNARLTRSCCDRSS